LFGGGYTGSYSNTVDAYDNSLTRSTPTALSVDRYYLAATTVGNYALFGGGYSASNVVDAYDTMLTRSTPTALSVGRFGLSATTVGDYALFGGGYSASNVVDAYQYK
jgi:tRNA G37 N-methylase TrmD